MNQNILIWMIVMMIVNIIKLFLSDYFIMTKGVFIQDYWSPLPVNGFKYIKHLKIYQTDDYKKIINIIKQSYKSRIKKFILNVSSGTLSSLLDTIRKCCDAIFVSVLSTSDSIRNIAPSNLFFGLTNNIYFFGEVLRFSNARNRDCYLIYSGIGEYYSEMVAMFSDAGVKIIDVDNTSQQQWQILEPLINQSQTIFISSNNLNTQKFITSKINNNYNGLIFFIEVGPLSADVASKFSATTRINIFFPGSSTIYPLESNVVKTLKYSFWESIPASWQSAIMFSNSLHSWKKWIKQQLIISGSTNYGINTYRVIH